MDRLVLAMTLLMLTGACGDGSDGNRAGANAMPAVAGNDAGPPDNGAADAVVPPAPAPPLAGDARIGRCHMDECSWFIVRGRDIVQRDAAGILYRLSVLGGASGHPDGNYPQDAGHARIEWNPMPHEVFVFCSLRLPAVMIRENGAWQTDALDFVNGPYGYQESAANLYVGVCHPGEDWASEGFAQRLGYEGREEAREIDLDRPEDIFRFARQP